MKLLVKAIESVRSQSCGDWELIVVNDDDPGPFKEGVLSLAESYGGDSRVMFVFHEGNLGQGAARNTAMRAAHGDWIAFLDSDDYWLDGYLAGVEEHIRETGCLLVSTDIVIQGSEGKRSLVTPMDSGPVLEHEICGDVISCPSGVCVRKDCVEAVGGFDEGLPAREDFDLWLRVFLANPKGVVSFNHSQDVVVLRDGHDSVSSSHERNVSGTEMVMAKAMSSGLLSEEQRRKCEVGLSDEMCLEFLKAGDGAGLRRKAREHPVFAKRVLFCCLSPFSGLSTFVRRLAKRLLYKS